VSDLCVPQSQSVHADRFAENAKCEDPVKLKESLALGEHVKKGKSSGEDDVRS
jgi:hypothetical protein